VSEGPARCPACCGTAVDAVEVRPQLRECAHCGHGWVPTGPAAVDYSVLSQRAMGDDAQRARRVAERLAFIGPVPDGARVLEVGCAEGDLGAALRAAVPGVHLEGIEPSGDATLAASRFDVLHRQRLEDVAFVEARFDRVLAFHVLEHLTDPVAALRRLAGLLPAGGMLVVEVPRRSGHPRVPDDRNREHLHFFCAASLCAMLQRAGLDALRLESGGYESPLYPDSLRVLATRQPGRAALAAALRERLARLLAADAAIWGTGGDFENYVRPYLPADLPVRLLDSSRAAQGRSIDGRLVEAPSRASGLRTVLVASCRYEAAIREAMRDTAFRDARAVGLAELLDGDAA
jgi:SAM-dependent methyltransferase